jgi:acyl carrier protein
MNPAPRGTFVVVHAIEPALSLSRDLGCICLRWPSWAGRLISSFAMPGARPDTLPTMTEDVSVERAVRDLLRSRSPLARGLSALPDALLLGPGGLGLDSIALVELLLDCEERFGMSGAAELLLGPPLTLGRLIAQVGALCEP